MCPALLVTRPQPDAARTAAQLDAIGIEPVIFPMLEARAVEFTLPPLEKMAATAATSANAIRFLLANGGHEPLLDRPLYAVGDQTAQEARQAGFTAVSSAKGTLADLAQLIAVARPGGPVFYPAAKEQSGDIAALLAPHGIRIETRVVYEMTAATRFPAGVLARLMQDDIAGALFYSRRTAAAFADLCKGHDFSALRSRLTCLCLAESCAAPLLARHFLRISLADHASGEAMLTLALAFAREQIKA